MRKQLYIILTAVLLTVLSLIGCDTQIGPKPDPCGDGDPQSVEVTEILNIAHPDTVTEGDTVTFRVTIKDSLLQGFRYIWSPRGSGNSCDFYWVDTEVSDWGLCQSSANVVRFIAPDVDSSRNLSIGLDIRHDSLETVVRNVYNNGCWTGVYTYTISDFDLYIKNTS